MRTSRTRWLTGVLLATAPVLAACGGSTDETATDTAVDASNVTRRSPPPGDSDCAPGDQLASLATATPAR